MDGLEIWLVRLRNKRRERADRIASHAGGDWLAVLGHAQNLSEVISWQPRVPNAQNYAFARDALEPSHANSPFVSLHERPARVRRENRVLQENCHYIPNNDVFANHARPATSVGAINFGLLDSICTINFSRFDNFPKHSKFHFHTPIENSHIQNIARFRVNFVFLPAQRCAGPLHAPVGSERMAQVDHRGHFLDGHVAGRPA